jgi:glycosyltransferase involved in cell wall biosynthesis
MKLAYCSPLNPIKSGISDYSEDLLPLLKEYFEIDIYVSGFSPDNKYIKQEFNIYDIKRFKSNHTKKHYDCNLYQMGNNHLAHEWIYEQALHEPGIVVLHDFAIHHMMAAMTVGRGKTELYLDEMQYAHGDKGFQAALSFIKGQAPPPWEDRAIEFPMNKKLIESAKGVIVHSYYTRNLIKEVFPYIPIQVIPHYTKICNAPINDYEMARIELGIKENTNVIATFGFVTPAKRLDKILTALVRLHRDGYEFKFYIVGEVPGEIEAKISQSGLPDDMVVLTGHVKLTLFLQYMKASDICVNLRYPVHGETSGSLHRLLGMGKPVLVSNVGSFREYPDDAVIKIDVTHKEEDQIYEALKLLLDNPQKKLEIGNIGYTYAKEHLDIEKVAKAYRYFIEGVVNERYPLENLVVPVSKLLAELDLDNNEQLMKECASVFPIYNRCQTSIFSS